eukprot:UN5035
MAYVTFQTADLAQVALQDPDAPGHIGPATIEPTRPHNTDPFSIVVFWHPGVELGPEDIAGHYELRLATLLGGGVNPQQPGIDEMKMALGGLQLGVHLLPPLPVPAALRDHLRGLSGLSGGLVLYSTPLAGGERPTSLSC